MATLALNSGTAIGAVENTAARTIVSSKRPIARSPSSSAATGNRVSKRITVKQSCCAIAAKSSTGEGSASSAAERSQSSAAVARFSGLRRLPAAKKSFAGGTRKKWQQYTEGPAREAHLRVVQMALSEIPDGPLGLYDPAMDKDACGVGFVAELSAQPTRHTVRTASLLAHYSSVPSICTLWIP